MLDPWTVGPTTQMVFKTGQTLVDEGRMQKQSSAAPLAHCKAHPLSTGGDYRGTYLLQCRCWAARRASAFCRVRQMLLVLADEAIALGMLHVCRNWEIRRGQRHETPGSTWNGPGRAVKAKRKHNLPAPSCVGGCCLSELGIRVPPILSYLCGCPFFGSWAWIGRGVWLLRAAKERASR